MKWIKSSQALPEIQEGGKASSQVLAGCWIVDPWLREDHPEKHRFIFGPCVVVCVPISSEFPQGKQWLTFGPSHNDITDWCEVNPPTNPLCNLTP